MIKGVYQNIARLAKKVPYKTHSTTLTSEGQPKEVIGLKASKSNIVAKQNTHKRKAGSK